jgi:hypothetical protein
MTPVADGHVREDHDEQAHQAFFLRDERTEDVPRPQEKDCRCPDVMPAKDVCRKAIDHAVHDEERQSRETEYPPKRSQQDWVKRRIEGSEGVTVDLIVYRQTATPEEGLRQLNVRIGIREMQAVWTENFKREKPRDDSDNDDG